MPTAARQQLGRLGTEPLRRKHGVSTAPAGHTQALWAGWDPRPPLEKVQESGQTCYSMSCDTGSHVLTSRWDPRQDGVDSG